MRYNGDSNRVRKQEQWILLEDSILAAHNKFFESNLTGISSLNEDDVVLYNAVIQYFKGSS